MPGGGLLTFVWRFDKLVGTTWTDKILDFSTLHIFVKVGASMVACSPHELTMVCSFSFPYSHSRNLLRFCCGWLAVAREQIFVFCSVLVLHESCTRCMGAVWCSGCSSFCFVPFLNFCRVLITHLGALIWYNFGILICDIDFEFGVIVCTAGSYARSA